MLFEKSEDKIVCHVICLQNLCIVTLGILLDILVENFVSIARFVHIYLQYNYNQTFIIGVFNFPNFKSLCNKSVWNIDNIEVRSGKIRYIRAFAKLVFWLFCNMLVSLSFYHPFRLLMVLCITLVNTAWFSILEMWFKGIYKTDCLTF